MPERIRFSTPEGSMPYIALLLGLLATLVIGYSLHITERAREQARFQNAVQQTEDAIQQRVETYVNLLLSTRGLFHLNENLTKAQFSQFIDGLQLRKRYPGIQGVGFSAKLETNASQGDKKLIHVPTTPIWPDTPRKEYHAVTALEPLDQRNERALGYDMFSEPVRRGAMKQARDSAIPAASARVTLVQEIEPVK